MHIIITILLYMNFLQKSIDKMILVWYNTVQAVIVLRGETMQFMKNYNSSINDVIGSGDFYIESISAAHTYITPPHSYKRYASEHKNDRILYIADGSMRFDMYTNAPVTANAGNTVYIPYNIAYKTEWLGDTRGEVYSVNYIIKDRGDYQITLNPEIQVFNECAGGMMKGLFEKCISAFNSGEDAYLLKCKFLFLELLYNIFTLETENKKSKISKAIKYIDINFLDEINISELARMCNLGECMFRRYFKEETGTSPLKYKNRMRIEYAYDLLGKRGYSVAEAMEMTGFYDASYFNKCFKLYIGKTPSECRLKK